MTCNQCIHYDVCMAYNGGMTRTMSMKNKAEKDCGYFVAKSKPLHICTGPKSLNSFAKDDEKTVLDEIQSLSLDDFIKWCRLKFDCAYCPAQKYCKADDIMDGEKCCAALRVYLASPADEVIITND